MILQKCIFVLIWFETLNSSWQTVFGSKMSSNPLQQLADDRMYMERALELAALATGKTSPNPCVGCVVVKNGAIIGEGWHEKAGLPHAEVNALLQAGDEANDATAYVSLEPCNHFGRTPPCTHALLRHGVKRVIAGMVDPDPRVAGCGLEYLKDQGAKVEVIQDELLNRACKNVNAPFVFRVMFQRAYAIVWSALDIVKGTFCDPFTTINFSTVYNVLSDVNAVVLGTSQFLQVDSKEIAQWPTHLAVVIDVKDGDNISLVRNHISTVVQLSTSIGSTATPRQWFIIRAEGEGNQVKNSNDDEDDSQLHVTYHTYSNHPQPGKTLEETKTLSVLTTLATLGFNSALFVVESLEGLKKLQQCEAIQKLVITDANPTISSSPIAFHEEAWKILVTNGLSTTIAPVCITGEQKLLSRLTESIYEEVPIASDSIPNHSRGILSLRLWMQD